MIDVRELHIGAHILADGIIVKMVDINRMQLSNPDFPYRMFVEGINSHGDKQIVGDFVNDDKIQPIPLTAELLQELGFEHSGSDSWKKRFDDKESIFVDPLKQYALVSIFPHDNMEESHVCIPPYLHSLENIVYLTIGKELIE